MTIKEWTHSHTRTVIAAVFLLGVLTWLYIHESKNRGQELAELKTYIAQKETERGKGDSELKEKLAVANEKIAGLEKKKDEVSKNPSSAPTIIHDYIPTTTPIQQTAPITKETPPDAPVAVLTRQNEQDIAKFALTCSQCNTEKAALSDQLKQKTFDLKTVTEERDKAVKTANGGSAWHKVLVIGKLTLCGGGGGALGAGIGRATQPNSQNGSAIGAAVGAGAGIVTCSLFGRN
jgi:hypothetical protein